MNDCLVPEEQARVSVFDHGLLYGDGVFEGLRSYSGRVFRLNAHLDRLWASARAICLEIPMSKDRMAQAVLDTLAANDLEDGYIRLVVTRGAGTLGRRNGHRFRPLLGLVGHLLWPGAGGYHRGEPFPQP